MFLEGVMKEKTGAHDLMNEILDHPSNLGRDAETIAHLTRVLKRKTPQELVKIQDDLKEGKKIGDHFS